MSNDLMKRLRDAPNWMRDGFHDWITYDRAPFEAADRIEELQTKLAKAAGSLEDMCAEFRGYDLPYGSKAYTKATAILAELKG